MATLSMKFNEDTEITGHIKLKLWVEADGSRDMDLFATVSKLDTKGDFVPLLYLENRDRYANTNPAKMQIWSPAPGLDAPNPGAMGRMRVSRRKLDPELSTDYWPVQAHTTDEYLSPGEIVPVEIDIWPTSRIWHKGQTIRVTITGLYKREGWTFAEKPLFNNNGNHIIHTGGKYDSYLQIPVIPPKYSDGEYIYR